MPSPIRAERYLLVSLTPMQPYWESRSFRSVKPMFVEVTWDTGMALEHLGPGLGLSVGDLDGDGFPELFTGFHFDGAVHADERAYAGPTVYMNKAGLGAVRRFEPLPLSAVSDLEVARCLEPCAHAQPHFHAASWMDFDGDGRDDLLILSGNDNHPHVLLRNDGGRLLRVVPGLNASTGSVVHTWQDVDHDGRLELVVSGVGHGERPLPAQTTLFTRSGTGMVPMRPPAAGFPLFTDVVRHAARAGTLSKNSTEAHRVEWSTEWQALDSPLGSDSCVLQCVSWHATPREYCCARRSDFGEDFHDHHESQLRKQLQELRPSDEHYAACAVTEDFDNDGDVDIFVAFVHVKDESQHLWYFRPLLSNASAVLLTFHDRRGFRHEPSATLFEGYADQPSQNLEGCVSVDHDNDGGMDVALTVAPFQHEEAGVDLHHVVGKRTMSYFLGEPRLIRNAFPRGHWLKVVLHGDGKLVSTSAIGSHVSVIGERTQRRTVHDGISGSAQADRRLHFGIGGDKGPLRLVVVWTDGTIDRLRVAKVNHIIHISKRRGGGEAAVTLGPTPPPPEPHG